MTNEEIDEHVDTITTALLKDQDPPIDVITNLLAEFLKNQKSMAISLKRLADHHAPKQNDLYK